MTTNNNGEHDFDYPNRNAVVGTSLSTPPTDGWEKDFDEKFKGIIFMPARNKDQFKQFIQQAIAEEREEIAIKVRSLQAVNVAHKGELDLDWVKREEILKLLRNSDTKKI